MTTKKLLFKYLIFNIIVFTMGIAKSFSQQDNRKIRIAKIEVYPSFLNEYKTALAEHAETALRLEPGVIALQAVYDKKQPELVTVFEVYANEEAYQIHLKTPHFLKYKNGTLKMVKSLELIDVSPIALEIKPELLGNSKK